MSDWYDRQGRKITSAEANALLTTVGYKKLAATELPDGRCVSTVWLGLDHSYGSGAPLIFETMVFEKDSYSDVDCDRYSTETEAMAGHAAMVAKWSKS